MPSPINKKTLEYLATLARIELSEKEEERFLKELESVLNHFEELKSLDTSKTAPMSGGSNETNILREDESRKNTDQAAGKSAFPEEKDGFLKIPPVF